jgi:hypothetical protein
MVQVFISNLEAHQDLTVYVNEDNRIVVNVPGHPFYIQKSSSRYTAGDEALGVTNNGIESGTIIFKPTITGTYYYASQNDTTYGKKIIAITRPAVEIALAEGAAEDIPCYCKGTLILTNQGYVKIEDIKKNDLVIIEGIITPSGILERNVMVVPVIWISSFKVKILNSESRPICIRKNAFGEHYPYEDLYISPAHKIFINDKLLLEANDIINGNTIYQDNECESVEYYHLECEEHSAIYANGCLSESYIWRKDIFDGDKNVFDEEK